MYIVYTVYTAYTVYTVRCIHSIQFWIQRGEECVCMCVWQGKVMGLDPVIWWTPLWSSAQDGELNCSCSYYSPLSSFPQIFFISLFFFLVFLIDSWKRRRDTVKKSSPLRSLVLSMQWNLQWYLQYRYQCRTLLTTTLQIKPEEVCYMLNLC